MKTILGFLIALMLILAPYKIIWEAPDAHHGRALPWSTYEQAAKDITGISMYMACNVETVIVSFQVGTDQYQSLASIDRDIFVHVGASGPDHVWLTKTIGESDIIIVRELEWPDLQKRYPDPCGYFEEMDAGSK